MMIHADKMRNHSIEKDHYGCTLLYQYARDENFDQVNAILATHPMLVNDYDLNRRAPLHWAASCNKESHVIQRLIEGGADTALTDYLGETPLFKAARNHDNIAPLLVLLKAGASTEVADSLGLVPLHFVAQGCNCSFTETLLKAGASVNICDKNRDTPLHCAMQSTESHDKQTAIAALLISYGADLTAKNKGGQTPAEVATIQNKHHGMRPS